jgi:hypothetical protein
MGRLSVNGYVYNKWSPFLNLDRNLFLRGGFLPLANQQVQWTSVTLLPYHSQGVLDGAVKTPLRPDQVNVLLLAVDWLFGSRLE